MTLWKTERGFAPFLPKASARYVDLAGLVVIVEAAGVLLLSLVALALLLPILSIMSFVIAGVVAVVARYSGIDCHAPGVSAWDIVALFTLVWIGAGMMSGAKQFVELFDRLATIHRASWLPGPGRRRIVEWFSRHRSRGCFREGCVSPTSPSFSDMPTVEFHEEEETST